MYLYKLTNKIGDYYTVAPDATSAQKKVESLLNRNDYGFSDARKVHTITIIAEGVMDETFLTNKFLVL